MEMTGTPQLVVGHGDDGHAGDVHAAGLGRGPDLVRDAHQAHASEPVSQHVHSCPEGARILGLGQQNVLHRLGRPMPDVLQNLHGNLP